MSLSAQTLAQTLRTAESEVARLGVFLDDLDGWDGEDCDTGTNARLTLAAMARSLDGDAGRGTFGEALVAAVEAGTEGGVGHVGVLLTTVLAAWAQSLDVAADLTPVALRRMLCANPWQVDHAHMDLSVAVESMFDEATSELETLGETLPGIPVIVSLFSAQAQYGLVNATSERTGRVDAGAAALAVLLASLDATVREDKDMLASLTRMLADLAGSPGAASPRPHAPAPGRAFTVDVLLRGTTADADAALEHLRALRVRHSCVGHSDLFGVGTWRLHVDTSAPLAVRPRTGSVVRFQVADARPDDMLGEDQLSDGVTHRGVRLLERRTLRRVERVDVLACTRAPGLVEDLAQAGAVVVLDPTEEDTGVLATALRRSSCGVCLVAPCDAGSARWVASLDTAGIDEGGAATVIVAGSRDDLSALAVAQACAPMFVPQPGGRAVRGAVASMLEDTARQALSASTVVPLPRGEDDASLALAAEHVASLPARRHRVLVGAGDGPALVALLRQLIAARTPGAGQDLEVIDGGQRGPSLLQGLR